MNQALTLKNPTFLTVISLISLVPLLFFQTTQAMIEVWLVNETFTHGFIIFPISLWLIWQKRAVIARYPINPEPIMIIILIPVLAAWLMGYLVDVQVIQQLTMISIIGILILIVTGRKVFLSILFPLVYLFFAVPLGQGLIPVMMDFTAFFTVSLVQLSGIPIYQDGLYFNLPSGNWSVVEECSGVRYLIASVALGSIYAYITYTSNLKRFTFIVISMIVPILANGIRAYGIVMIGHLSGMKLATGVDHLLYGWLFFGLVIFLMFYIGSYWADPVSNTDRQPAPESQRSDHQFKSLIKTVSLAFGITLSTLLLATQSKNSTDLRVSDPLPSIPVEIQGWTLAEDMPIKWQPEFKNPDVNISNIYQSNDRFVQLDIAHYFLQRQGAEAVSSQNQLTNPHGGDWKLTHSSKFKVQALGIEVSESILRLNNERILVWHWYKVGTMNTSSPYKAKLYEIYNRLINRRNDASIISISTNLQESQKVSRNTLKAFTNDAEVALNQEMKY